MFTVLLKNPTPGAYLSNLLDAELAYLVNGLYASV